jgi:hypothetical protein
VDWKVLEKSRELTFLEASERRTFIGECSTYLGLKEEGVEEGGRDTALAADGSFFVVDPPYVTELTRQPQLPTVGRISANVIA